MKIYSYVVHHDDGFAPNPFFDYCTLVHCKFGSKGSNGTFRKNIIESAEKGDWIIGTGGASNKSSGHGTIIYAMKVTEKITLREYFHDKRFSDKKPILTDYKSSLGDNIKKDISTPNRFALISDHFYYFGRNALQIPKKFMSHPKTPLEKKGPRYRTDFGDDFINEFTNWIQKTYKTGFYGDPCTYELNSISFKNLKRRNC